MLTKTCVLRQRLCCAEGSTFQLLPLVISFPTSFDLALTTPFQKVILFCFPFFPFILPFVLPFNFPSAGWAVGTLRGACRACRSWRGSYYGFRGLAFRAPRSRLVVLRLPTPRGAASKFFDHGIVSHDRFCWCYCYTRRDCHSWLRARPGFD